MSKNRSFLLQYEEGVTNPAFDGLERLHVNGNTWSETSSDVNKDDTLNSQKLRQSFDVTDSLPRLMKRPDGYISKLIHSSISLYLTLTLSQTSSGFYLSAVKVL